MIYEEMYMKKGGHLVRVYDITDGMATIFDEYLYQKQNNGWAKVKVSTLVPAGYPLDSKNYVSKTRRNKAKARMHLVEAVWQTTDGLTFQHENLDVAINHELAIMEREEENKE